MDTLSATSALPVVPPALPPPPDTSAPTVTANDPMTAIRLLASLSAFVGQRLDTEA